MIKHQHKHFYIHIKRIFRTIRKHCGKSMLIDTAQSLETDSSIVSGFNLPIKGKRATIL